MYKYAIAIVLYNPDNNVVWRIKDYSKVFSQILLTDNSEKKNQSLINKVCAVDGVIYHDMGKNTGMSGALNFAFEWAIENKLDFLLTMDQDTLYPNDEIRSMIQYIESSKGSCAIYSANYAKMYEKNGEMVPGPISISRDENQDALFSMTSGSWMNVKYLPEIVPISDWFIGFVDYDVCAAIKTKYSDAKILRVGNSVMYQTVGQTVESNLINKTFHVVHLSDQRYLYMMRNIELFKKKYKQSKIYQKVAERQKARILLNILFENNRRNKIHAVREGIQEAKNW